MTDLTILSTGHDVADARLHRIAAAAVAAGLAVEVRAHGSPDDAPDGVIYRGRHDRPGRPRRFARASTAAAGTRSRVVLVVDPDLIVPSLVWTRLRGQRIVVDVHEDYEAVTRDRPWTRGLVGVAARIAVRLAMRFAARADLTVVADDHLPPREARCRLVVRHAPEVTDVARALDKDPCPRAVYIGDVRPSRGLWSMLLVLSETPKWTLDIVGRLSEVTREEVDRRLCELDLADRVTFYGQQPPDRAWKVASGAWCGLALLEETPAYRAAVPTKVYEYLAAGIPVLASPLPRVQGLLESVGAGMTATSSDEAGAILRRWGSEPSTVAAMAAAGISWTESRPLECDTFDDLVSRLLPMTGRMLASHADEDRGVRGRRRARHDR